MRHPIWSGMAQAEVEIPDRSRVVSANPPLPPIADLRKAVESAIDQPAGSAPLDSLLRPGMKVCVAFDDIAVPGYPVETPDFREVALGVLIERFERSRVPLSNVRLLCANALHRKNTRGELSTLLGELTTAAWPLQRLGCHDAEDPDGMVDLGETSRGFEVRVNRAAFESDLTIYLNVTASPMNGGWKSYVVGLSDFRSIRHHHRPWPHAQGHSVMDPKRSAFHRLLREMGEVLDGARARAGRKLFSIESAYNSESPARCCGVFAGHPQACHELTLEMVERQQAVSVGAPADVMIVSVPDAGPYAQNAGTNPLILANLGLSYAFGLYQGQPPVRPGGWLILAAEWTERFDDLHHPSYRDFYQQCLKFSLDAQVVWDTFVEDFVHRPQYVHAYRHAFGFHAAHPFFMWNTTAFPRRHLGKIVTVGGTRGVAEHLGFEHAWTVADAIGLAESELGKNCSILAPKVPPPSILRVTA